jgi:hypothetical protein
LLLPELSKTAEISEHAKGIFLMAGCAKYKVGDRPINIVCPALQNVELGSSRLVEICDIDVVILML